jgi:cell division protein FtsW
VLTITGLVAVWSASFVVGLAEFGDSQHYILRQAIWAALGAVLMVAAARTDYAFLKEHAVALMAGTLVVLIAVLLVGVQVNGARRWLGVGEFTVQPAEFAKLTVIVYLAAWLASKGREIRSFEYGFIPFVVIIAMVGSLIMLQPSLGTTLIILAVTVTMFWVAGASPAQMLALAVGGLLIVAVLATAAGYRMERMTTFLHAESDPSGDGFQTLQALIAMGNGGVSGLGLGASRAKFFYVPESHTDGIYAIIGEELGLIATVAVLALYVILMFRGYQLARRCDDQFAMLVATGITTWIAVQAMLNLGGILRILPLTGVPLPFLSFGGSALAAAMLGIGVLMSISRYSTARSPSPAPSRRVVRRMHR